jgi:RimJ/RimL family protein N-acetyltransferase
MSDHDTETEKESTPTKGSPSRELLDGGAELRQARADDRKAVVAFTEDTWADRGGSDYIPDVFEEWVETDGPRQRTFVVDVLDEDDPGAAIAGIVQFVLVSETEAWGQGIRVNPNYRGRGLSTAMTHAGFDWAHERGATVARNLVFSWNVASLGLSRGAGFQPATEFRYVHPAPDPDGLSTREGATEELQVTDDPDVAWSFWVGSDAYDALSGLSLTTERSWALSRLTRAAFGRIADEQRVVAVESDRGARGAAYRTRTYEREEEGNTLTWAEYGLGVWSDLAGARAVLSTVARDAAALGADRTRVLVPETPRTVTDTAYLRVDVDERPEFVLEADLTADYRSGAHLGRRC